jgi:ABC-type nitrate/sulfonate/bicarbonate transport system permease component
VEPTRSIARVAPSAPAGGVGSQEQRTAAAPPRGMRRRRERTARRLLPVATTVALLAAWEALAHGVLPAELPPPSDVIAWYRGELGAATFWNSLGTTMSHWGAGLAISVALGITVGVAMGAVPLLQRLFQPTLEILRPIPALIYLPVVVLLWGATSQTAIFLVVTAAFWPMLFQTFYGVAAIDPMLRDTGRLFGLSWRERITTITMPSVLPYVATGVRISSSLALVVAIGVELIAGIPGLGADLITYNENGMWDAVYAIVVLAGILGLVLNLILERIERRLLRWHVSYRGTST